MTRFVIVKARCPICRQMVKVINMINLRLPIEKRIRIVDYHDWEEFGLDNNPLFSKIEEELPDKEYPYPFLYIDGIVTEPAPNEELFKIYLQSFLSKDLKGGE